MENDQEAIRLEMKTDRMALEKQALWAGIKPGMRVVDIGCGSGKPTQYLHKLVQPNGRVTGVDSSEERILHARNHFGKGNVDYVCRDIREPLDDIGEFDFIWIRFVLEYYRSSSFEIVKNVSKILKPGGILCLIDLDHNCLSHYGQSPKLDRTFKGIMETLERTADFDPYMGRKLYSYMFDLCFEEIDVDLSPHHLIFGELKEIDAFNWMKKADVAARKSGYMFEEYLGGFEEFYDDFKKFFFSPRRFTYTPIISCRGRKPQR